jgi:hypothetical protein
MQESLGWDSLLGALKDAEAGLQNFSDPRADALMAIDAIRFEIEVLKTQAADHAAQLATAAEEQHQEQQLFALQIQMHLEEQGNLKAVIDLSQDELRLAQIELQKMGAKLGAMTRDAKDREQKLAQAHAEALLSQRKQFLAQIEGLELELQKERRRHEDLVAYVNRR